MPCWGVHHRSLQSSFDSRVKSVRAISLKLDNVLTWEHKPLGGYVHPTPPRLPELEHYNLGEEVGGVDERALAEGPRLPPSIPSPNRCAGT